MKYVFKFYSPSDYPLLQELYKSTGWFDPETDSEDRIQRQIINDPQAILLALDKNRLVGSITILPTGRIGLLFRLNTTDIKDASSLRKQLIHEGEKILKSNGYNEVHILAPEEDTERQMEYEKNGFIKGKPYRWFWKRIHT